MFYVTLTLTKILKTKCKMLVYPKDEWDQMMET